jgi:predicted ATP-dependent protease
MLRKDVVKNVADGRFHIYAVKTIDEGIEILTGTEAGAKQPDGSYPEDSINFLVDQKLKELAEEIKKFAGTEEAKKKKEDSRP